jgi:AcrR family transcriptional regulator
MATRKDTSAETRAPLNRERVLQAAIVLADSGGIDALSMRKLGQALGVEAMSLYNHVANKEDILNGILELVHAEMLLATGVPDWKTSLRASAISAHEVLFRHRWAASLRMSTVARVSPGQLRWMDAVLGCLREAGFSAELTHHAFHALESHIVGFTLWLVSMPALGDELRALAADFLKDFPVDDYPYFVEHAHYHLQPANPDEEGEFEFGLDLILDGLERMRDNACTTDSDALAPITREP